MSDQCVVDVMRHGDTGGSGYCGKLNDPLTPLGWTQMWHATQQEYIWHAIISSPLKRCAEFSKAFSDKTGLPLELDARLREYHFGDWEGKSVEQLMVEDSVSVRQFWNDPWAYTPPNAEGLDEFEHRVFCAWDDIVSCYRSKRVLMVTHGGVIRLLLCHTGGLSRNEFLTLTVPHASIHTLPTKMVPAL